MTNETVSVPIEIEPVRKSVTVRTSVEHAFELFTAGFDSWWPRSHHIGKSPMQAAFIEQKLGGRCYTLQEDGTDCDWGTVIAWEPPHRVVLAWQIDPEWQYEPDRARASEVEVRFTAAGEGMTRVDLEHRHFERHGAAGGATIRNSVDSEMGWAALLALYAARVATIDGGEGRV